MNLGEQLAKEYLLGQGLQFVEANFRLRMGEIDLIMKDGETLVFVEVKYRTSERWGTSVEQVTGRKIQKIKRVAQGYLQGYFQDAPYVRFDVIGISPCGAGYRFNWVKGAFE
ncbi:MAG TPA: YraN family protein [Firmicutes bacterium]|mgnify:FL=1|jgi:putative endonuclease|nr:YraN family protein [Bacillota bacterium]